ncbi:hypothetical protein BDZ45DRAFT_720354 [Acephala macrosclerotiorum]|nr:hypothetical protein BDZ45DRAFT_720354 [Acephala macrosclerotiorum]
MVSALRVAVFCRYLLLRLGVLNQAAAGGCLGGVENVLKELMKLKIRVGELVDGDGDEEDPEAKPARAGFGVESEVVGLRKLNPSPIQQRTRTPPTNTNRGANALFVEYAKCLRRFPGLLLLLGFVSNTDIGSRRYGNCYVRQATQLEKIQTEIHRTDAECEKITLGFLDQLSLLPQFNGNIVV